MSNYLFRLLVFMITSTVLTTGLTAKEWFVYERCELSDETPLDGDSFSVKAGTGYTYVFRLYGVDCAEMNDQSEARLKEQCKEFGLDEEVVFGWGEKAAAFTREFLRKPFIVFTQKIKVGSVDGKSRYYAIVINSEGMRLDEALLQAGLARCDGIGAEWDEAFWGRNKVDLPRRSEAKRFLRKLHALESKAKRERIGIWEK